MKRRLSRIFKPDGKTVIIAMDHGAGLSVNPALDDMEGVLSAIIKGGADAILTTYGIATRYEDILKDIGLILRMDGGSSILSPVEENSRLLYTVEDAVKLGADAMACMGFPGAPYEYDSMKNVAELASKGREWGIPLVAEMLPGGFNPAVENSVANLTLAARTGCEYGASVIKTSFNGTAEEYKAVIRAAYQPVVVLGGEKVKDLSSLFVALEGAMEAGAAGVAIGRNVWKHKDPEAVTRALVDLVHNGKKAADIKGL